MYPSAPSNVFALVCSGLLIYFSYGVRFSVQKQRMESSGSPVEISTIDQKHEPDSALRQTKL